MIYLDQLSCPASFPWRYAVITANDVAITELWFANDGHEPNSSPLTHRAKQQLHEYFNHKRQLFDLPLYQKASTFAHTVYDHLIALPYGQVITYSDLAQPFGGQKMARAIGHVCSSNLISIFIPCHRIISKNGKLTGYTGGLETKAWLIAHEKQTHKLTAG